MASNSNSNSSGTAVLQSLPQDLKNLSETEIVAEARNGSSIALEQLMEMFERRLFRLALNVTNNYEDAEEVVQNAFLKAFRNLNRFRGDSRFYTWIVRIALNEAFMKIRRHRPTFVSTDGQGEGSLESIVEGMEDWGPNPEQRYSQEELRGILERGVKQLSEGNRIVFQLRDMEEFSSEETARILNLSIPAVKARLLRARLQLRNFLDVYFGGRRASRTHDPSRSRSCSGATFT
jgi:RNA polymerase sigma-70 factor, ECF subfamily